MNMISRISHFNKTPVSYLDIGIKWARTTHGEHRYLTLVRRSLQWTKYLYCTESCVGKCLSKCHVVGSSLDKISRGLGMSIFTKTIGSISSLRGAILQGNSSLVAVKACVAMADVCQSMKALAKMGLFASKYVVPLSVAANLISFGENIIEMPHIIDAYTENKKASNRAFFAFTKRGICEERRLLMLSTVKRVSGLAVVVLGLLSLFFVQGIALIALAASTVNVAFAIWGYFYKESMGPKRSFLFGL